MREFFSRSILPSEFSFFLSFFLYVLKSYSFLSNFFFTVSSDIFAKNLEIERTKSQEKMKKENAILKENHKKSCEILNVEMDIQKGYYEKEMTILRASLTDLESREKQYIEQAKMLKIKIDEEIACQLNDFTEKEKVTSTTFFTSYTV